MSLGVRIVGLEVLDEKRGPLAVQGSESVRLYSMDGQLSDN
jgi:hypothetical protein